MSPSQRIAGRFEIRDSEHDLLGRGSMGDVYRAADTRAGRLAAIAATLPPDAVAAARERGRARDLEATVAELLDELAADEAIGVNSG